MIPCLASLLPRLFKISIFLGIWVWESQSRGSCPEAIQWSQFPLPNATKDVEHEHLIPESLLINLNRKPTPNPFGAPDVFGNFWRVPVPRNRTLVRTVAQKADSISRMQSLCWRSDTLLEIESAQLECSLHRWDRMLP